MTAGARGKKSPGTYVPGRKKAGDLSDRDGQQSPEGLTVPVWSAATAAALEIYGTLNLSMSFIHYLFRV